MTTFLSVLCIRPRGTEASSCTPCSSRTSRSIKYDTTPIWMWYREYKRCSNHEQVEVRVQQVRLLGNSSDEDTIATHCNTYVRTAVPAITVFGYRCSVRAGDRNLVSHAENISSRDMSAKRINKLWECCRNFQIWITIPTLTIFGPGAESRSATQTKIRWWWNAMLSDCNLLSEFDTILRCNLMCYFRLLYFSLYFRSKWKAEGKTPRPRALTSRSRS